MKLQVIYTFEKKEQQILNVDFNPEIIATEKSFVDFCFQALKTKYSFTTMMEWLQNPKEKEVPKVVKLSGCIYLDGEEYNNEPEWWKTANGKVHFNN